MKKDIGKQRVKKDRRKGKKENKIKDQTVLL